MAQEINGKICRIISDVTGVPVVDINDDSGPDTIDKWDSVTHINIMLALEEEFEVSLSDEDVLEMLSVSLIRMILSERLSDNSG